MATVGSNAPPSGGSMRGSAERVRGSRSPRLLPMNARAQGAAKEAGRRLRIRGITPMSKVTSLTIALIACALLAGAAESQTLDARRLGMGGVVTSDVGDFSGANIAFRAVPKGAGGTGSIPPPPGLIQYLSDHPLYDSNDSRLNLS